MGFTTDEEMVRVDFFKPSGKWYATEEMKWTGSYDSGYLPDVYRMLLWKTFGKRFQGLFAVCLEPYHQHAHPLCVAMPESEPIPLSRAQLEGGLPWITLMPKLSGMKGDE